MSLICSISGIRGTIGSGPDNLNPENLIKFIAAFSETLASNKKDNKRIKVVIGRDGRVSGEMFLSLAINTLVSLGVDVLNLDLATTPTVEMAVILEKADGGIIISASHNPMDWNALKLLNSRGEFLNKKEGQRILKKINNEEINFVGVDSLGKVKNNFSYHNKHILEILKLSLVKKDKIKKSNLKIVVDGVNSVGALVIPELLKSLGVKNIFNINKDIEGRFNHNPEPIDKNLKQLCLAVKKNKADLGIAVDPDVDRLAIIDEKGHPIGEEYTLISIADYVFKNFSVFRNKYNKNSVSNLSSSMALKDLTMLAGGKYEASAVGEINVVEKMKKNKAVIGGEGNGGIIYPELHYGRDALVGIALFLSYLSTENKTCSELRERLPNYFLLKEKIVLDSKVDLNKILLSVEKKYKSEKILKTDGIKIIFKKDKSWIHLRKSNTEPIIRIYCEAPNKREALKIFSELELFIKNFIN
ncbi:MAG TPA: phosphoglucosamine mutase [bacterium]|nr:phosphoglucosamine mutase [bacterium]